MSFILDALKKSETDRQRQNGPALFEVRVAPPRSGLPLWAVGLGVLLAVNLVIVAWVLLRRPTQAEANAQNGGQSFQAASDGRGGQGGAPSNGSGTWQGGQPGQGQGSPAGSGAWQGGQGSAWQGSQAGGGAGQGGGQAGSQAGGNGAGQSDQQGQGGSSQAGGGAWQGAPGGQGGQNGQAGQPGQGGGQAWQGAQQGQPGWGAQQSGQGGYPGQPGGPPGTQGQSVVPVNGTAPTAPLAQAAGPTTPGSFNGAAETGGEKLSADDYAPAAEPPQIAPFGNRVARGTSNGVPLYQDVSLQPGTHLPELRLDLHVFAAQPQNRFVMINMHKLHEGDSLPEGVRVESITPEGAVLSKDGTRFLLPRQ